MRTFFFWFVCLSMVVTLGPFFLFISALGRKKEAQMLAVFWSWILLKIAGAPLKVCGKEHLEKYSRFIIVANHQSYMDIFAIIVLLKKVPHFLAKKELFRIPIFGQCLRAIDVIEIDRQNPDRALQSIKQALGKGFERPVVIFPEGTRSRNGRLQPFRKKGLNLLMETGLPFVPLAFYGTREIMPKGSYRVKPHLICVAVGEPIKVSPGLAPQQKDEFRHKLWNEVNSLREKARQLCSC